MNTCSLNCPCCGAMAGQIFVHGQYLCNHCKQPVMPCCSGETALDFAPKKQVLNSPTSDLVMQDLKAFTSG